MLDFMEHVQNAFYEASHWNVDNSYGALNATARGTSPERVLAPLALHSPMDCSIARLSDSKRLAIATIFARFTEFRYFIYPGQCRRR
jgi:hypothetical protein